MPQKKEIIYPAEITFKSIFIHNPEVHVCIETLLLNCGISGEISQRQSKNNKFTSYTITAVFTSEAHLNELCIQIAAIHGFIMMI